jgi:hypothetical protein
MTSTVQPLIRLPSDFGEVVITIVDIVAVVIVVVSGERPTTKKKLKGLFSFKVYVLPHSFQQAHLCAKRNL